MSGHNGGFSGAMIHAPIVKAVPQDQTQAFEPRSINEAMQLAGLLVASRLLPRSVTTPEAAFAIIATGRELGLTAMQSLRTIHVIEGKPTLSADLIAALVKSRGDVCKYFMLVESTATVARYETQRIGEPKPTLMSFSIEDAQRAGVATKDNWKKYPAAMLRARCITALARAVYPDLAMGLYDPDELEPIPVPEDRRVYVEAEPPPVRDTVTFVSLCELVDAACTPAQLNSSARQAQKYHRDGLISDEQLNTIKLAVTSKRAAASSDSPPEERQPGDDV